MEAFKSIPRTLQGMIGIHSNIDSSDHLAQYKQNVKLFIKGITSQVSQMIDKYEKKIAMLEKQNKRLKQNNSHLDAYLKETPIKNKKIDHERHSAHVIPLSKKTPNIDKMQVAQSFLFNKFSHQIDDDVKFSKALPKHIGKQRNKNENENYPIELIVQEPFDDDLVHGKSHFQVRLNQKKHHEAELRQFLQSGSKSMNITTQKYLKSIGKNQKQEVKQEDELPLCRDNSDSSITFKKVDSDVNQSLSQICNNLDNSLLAKRSKSKNKDKSSKKQSELLSKQRQEEQVAKMMKNIGLKNLLMRLRENVESSAKKGPQIIKSSRLISCGLAKSPMKEINLTQTNRNGSKVLINPVPVDIIKKSKTISQNKPKRQSLSPGISQFVPRSSSPTKSILKQSSTVLTKSIELSSIQDLDS